MINGLMRETTLLKKAKNGEELTHEELTELVLIMLRPDRNWTKVEETKNECN